MSEQATNSHDAALAKIQGMFSGDTEQPEEETEQSVETAQVEEQGTEQQGQEPAQQQSEETEVEIEGEKYLVPKKIADRFIQHADYTRKTQDLAELRRATSAEREAVNIERAFQQAVAEETNQLALINVQLAQFQNVNWAAMETDQLLRTREQLNQLKEAKASVEGQIKAKRGQFDDKIKSVTQEALQAGEKYIAQHIKDFDEGKKKELLSYGISEGYTQAEMDKIIDPRIVVSLWKAKQYDDLVRSSPEILNKAARAAPVVKPGSTQRQPSRIQKLGQAIKTAKSPQGKKDAAVDYFTAKFGG